MDDLERLLDDGKEYMHINLEKVLSDRAIPSPVRLLAADIQRCPYMTVGDFFKNLSDTDVLALSEIVDNQTESDMENLLLMTIMLAKAEGADGAWDDKALLAKQLSKLQVLITITSLERKGIVRVWYENYTLGNDMDDDKLVEKLY